VAEGNRIVNGKEYVGQLLSESQFAAKNIEEARCGRHFMRGYSHILMICDRHRFDVSAGRVSINSRRLLGTAAFMLNRAPGNTQRAMLALEHAGKQVSNTPRDGNLRYSEIARALN
jgi:hypothetical protein